MRKVCHTYGDHAGVLVRNPGAVCDSSDSRLSGVPDSVLGLPDYLESEQYSILMVFTEDGLGTCF